MIILKNKFHNEKKNDGVWVSQTFFLSPSQNTTISAPGWWKELPYDALCLELHCSSAWETDRETEEESERPSTLPGNWKRRVGDERPQLAPTHSARPSVQQEALWPKFTLPHPHRHLFSLLGKHLEKYESEKKNSASFSTSYVRGTDS